ncbi:hypothetical protein [Paenibacillus whitsoniae]|uniref:Uncharacterized protein n=1 Tax=Paenibacillus whitsoniae TaxID=2496558 RepID=A0A3S0BH04_9BACL|nr:hypothetical protein [Paenibacillus whitsoniae]RTE03013.1 hypothetical protein EJQ19_28665 [Paenibacillus whitsoniae]
MLRKQVEQACAKMFVFHYKVWEREPENALGWSIKPAKEQEFSSFLSNLDEMPAKKQEFSMKFPFWGKFRLETCFIAGIW